jgi:hypothetical protein
MVRNLTFAELARLFNSVFALRPQEKALTVFVDLPSVQVRDNTAWIDRRRIATEWYVQLQSGIDRLPLTALNYCAYENVGSNNNDLPSEVLLVERVRTSGALEGDVVIPTRGVLEESSIVLAMTEFSATAPLKNLARELGFRGATLPGFTRAMIPALGLDYKQVNQRVMDLKSRLDRAVEARIEFHAREQEYRLSLDLRYRTAHASGGIISEGGNVANLPSGEAYIVPFEGDRQEASASKGELPVQFGNEVVVFQIENNRVFDVTGEGEHARDQRERVIAEPAYGNIAELGLGVLGEWGIKPVGSTLLDEKLGLHIAFGRSDHFGGAVGPRDFKSPSNVVHIDWVYTPQIQPHVEARLVELKYENGQTEAIISNGILIA